MFFVTVPNSSGYTQIPNLMVQRRLIVKKKKQAIQQIVLTK